MCLLYMVCCVLCCKNACYGMFPVSCALCLFGYTGNHEMRDQNMAMGESGFFAVCRNMFKMEYADKLFLLIHMVSSAA